MLTRRQPNPKPKSLSALLVLLALAPFQLAAKGCEVATVGQDGCVEGETCDKDPGQTCGGLTGGACGKGEYCHYTPSAACGVADQTGVCKPKPEACDGVYRPVCGCDGKTYGNDCEAYSAGVSVAKTGECDGKNEPNSATCGGLTGRACGDDEYCDYAPDAACGAADQTGVCKPKPKACDDIYRPVCGCDGKTYGNDCEAYSAGVSVAKTGECDGKNEPNSATCGGLTGWACGDDEYCDYAPDAACGAADQTGVCKPKPKACDDIYRPVCGCDGKTYDNECEAAYFGGVSIAHEGECGSPSGETCGGLLGASCPKGQYCDYSENNDCELADATGVCRPIPDACDAVYDPVCGCDGKTYGNACEAAAQGVTVGSEGECK